MQYNMLSLPDPVTSVRTSVGPHASSRHALVGTDAVQVMTDDGCGSS
jgi:hypothetical protein